MKSDPRNIVDDVLRFISVEPARRERERLERLRLHLVANAPPVPAWFDEEPPSKPEPIDQLAECTPQAKKALDLVMKYGLDVCDLSVLTDEERRWLAKYADYRDRMIAWESLREANRVAQWPWKYAELVLAARPKPTGGAA